MSLIIEIENPLINSKVKFEKALSLLMKATGHKVDFKLDNHSKSEPTPYTSLRQLADEAADDVEDKLYIIWQHIIRNWMGQTLQKAIGDTLPFKKNGKIMIDPRSGLVLTKGRWKEIQRELTKMFKWLYGSSDDRLVAQAIGMGKLIQQIDPAKRTTVKKDDLPIDDAAQVVSSAKQYRNVYNWADINTGELITDVTDRSRRAITRVIMQGYQDNVTQKQLQRNLFDEFSVLNRDWRRIAETETATNFNNGYLTAELTGKKEDEEYIFMIGISGAGACDFCSSRIADHVVILLDSAPAGGDTKTIDGTEYTAIWPGKSNVGRKKADWWVSAGSQHPHCVTGDQLVATSKLGAVTKAFYEGIIIEITTASGNRMSVTENHPVLTPDGFIAAKFLNQGSYVLVSSNPDRVHQIVNPNNYQRPTIIEDLFTSLRHSSRVSPAVMEVSNEDFYGDGRFFNSDVDVVFTDGLLGSYFQSLFFEELYEVLLNNTLIVENSIGFDSFSSSFQFLQRHGLSPSSILSFLNHLISFFLSHSAQSKLVSFLTSSDIDSMFVKSVMHGVPAHSKLSGEFIHRFSQNVPIDNDLGEVSISDSGSFIIPSRVTSVVRRSFNGYVYDLQDDMYGLYTCNGVVVKNCRCTWTRYYPGMEKYMNKLKDATSN